jgi:hypothetical protein
MGRLGVLVGAVQRDALMWSQWYTALVGPTDVFNPVTHKRSDLPVERVEIREREEDIYAHVTLTLANWVHGLNEPSANQYLFLSREKHDGTLQLMAYGRLVGIPLRGSRQDELPVVELICSPLSPQGPLATCVTAYETLPQFDPVLVAPANRADPREILDGWFAFPHCDRATHAFSVVDGFGVGAPNFAFPAPWMDPMPSSTITEPPVAAVDITLRVEWVQSVSGTYDISTSIKDAFPYGFIDTLTGDQLEKSWFKHGGKVNGDSGWTFQASSLTKLDPNAFPTQVPDGAPLTAGPFTGAPEKQNYVSYYSWVTNSTLTTPYTVDTASGKTVKRFNYSGAQSGDPGNLHGAKVYFERQFYDCEVVMAYRIRQKRVEVVNARLTNGCQTVAVGPVKKLTLKCEDITDDSSATQWQPNHDYAAGTYVRVGLTTQQCQNEHVSTVTWASDQTITLPNGTVQTNWIQIANDPNAYANPASASYFQTVRGEQTWQAALAKARRILASSTRSAEVKIRHQLTDALLSISTAATGSTTTPTDILDGGGCTAKIVAYTIMSDQGDEYVEVTLKGAVGTGQGYTANPVTLNNLGQVANNPVIVGDPGVLNVDGQAWDVIEYGNWAQFQPIQLPNLSCKVETTNDADDQTTYVNAHDFVYNDAIRNDDQANEPANLLKASPTSVTVYLTQLSGIPVLYNNFAPVMMNYWNGPLQYNAEAA